MLIYSDLHRQKCPGKDFDLDFGFFRILDDLDLVDFIRGVSKTVQDDNFHFELRFHLLLLFTFGRGGFQMVSYLCFSLFIEAFSLFVFAEKLTNERNVLAFLSIPKPGYFACY